MRRYARWERAYRSSCSHAKPWTSCPTVRSANREPAQRLVAHLLEVHGHERLSFIGDPAASPDAEDRWQGFLDAHRAQGVPAPPAAFAAPFHEHGGREAAGAALDSRNRPTGLVCASDEIALGAYRAVSERGLRPGIDIAVTGWDDIQLARFVTPALTTVRQPMDRLGRVAAELLIAARGRRARRVPTLESHVVIRASCGCREQSSTTREVVQ